MILYDLLPTIIEASIDAICQLNTLVVLDLSLNRRAQENLVYSKPTITLAKLIRALPKLLSLDISGTNLAGAFSFVEEEELAYIKKELSINEEEYVRQNSSDILIRNDFLELFQYDRVSRVYFY